MKKIIVLILAVILMVPSVSFSSEISPKSRGKERFSNNQKAKLKKEANMPRQDQTNLEKLRKDKLKAARALLQAEKQL